MPYNPSVRGRRQWLREGRRHWRRLWLALAAMAGLVALGGFVWLWWKGVPTLYQNSGAGSDARAEAVTGTRTALMVGLAGVGAVGALWLNNRTYRLTQQGQITDRYTKAVEQLGGDKLDVRLGGIYALERIAVDSKRDHQIIVAVLSAFVRERTDPVRTDKAIVDEGLRHPLGEAYQSQTHKSAARKSEPQPAVDVQAAVTVLSRLPRRRGVGRGELGGVRLAGTRLDWADLATARLGWANLSGAQLQWAKLSGADLRGSNLSGASLQNAKLSQANLQEVDMSGADLWGANLSDVQLQRADLSGADLSSADLVDARLMGADLSGANLSSADLSGATLYETKLLGAQLQAAQLYGAIFVGKTDLLGASLQNAQLSRLRLEEADLSGAQLNGARLVWVDLRMVKLLAVSLCDTKLFWVWLQGADLSYADLRGAQLSRTYLEGANLSGAQLQGANLSGVKGLTEEQLAAATGNALTQLPRGVQRPSAWPAAKGKARGKAK
jgi:uncharacterized protein YjbI with pentapeptide repeats